MKSLIYYRKSTDRDDKQANSLEHQLNNCRNTARLFELEIFEEIGESKSAKTEFTREGFNKMIDLCKKKKVDYIIIDEPKRLSRNNIDTSRIVDLMDKKLIKGILATGRKHMGDNSRDKFLLQLYLSLSKMDNEDRAKDVKDKMETAVKKGQWMGKAVFGYKNVGTKGKKDVELVPEEARLVKKAFKMRVNGKSLQTITNFINNEMGFNWTPERTRKMLMNTKYYGLQSFGDIKCKLNSPGYKPIISEELFNKANKIVRTIQIRERPDLPKYFKGLLKDTDGINFYPYIKKNKDGKTGNIYYHNSGYKSQYYVNISEKAIFEEFENYLKNFSLPAGIMELCEEMLKDIFKNNVIDNEKEVKSVENKILKQEERLESIKLKWIDGKLNDEEYKNFKKSFEKDKNELEKNRVNLLQENTKIDEKVKSCLEVLFSLSNKYSGLSDEKKVEVIKMICLELLLNTKKELLTGNTPLL